MPEKLRVEGKEFALLGLQRKGTAVYRGSEAYLRLGPPRAISDDLEFHRRMEGAGYPVAKILSEGTHDGAQYFIEESLGDRSFTASFGEEYRSDGKVSDASFDALLKIAMRFAYAQLTTAEDSFRKVVFAEAIRLPALKSELPEYADALQNEFDTVARRLQLYPSVITHGDLNPSNMYPRGVIDLEDSFDGPLGFDITSVLMTQDWFPDGDYEFVSKYRISEEQKARCIAECDKLYARAGFPVVSAAYRDLSFCRAVWLCAGMNEWPKIQKWRFDKLEKDFLHD